MTGNVSVPAPAKKRRPSTDGPGALALIEESVHLLRRAPASVFLFHVFGAGVWVLGVLFAWAYVSWFRPPREDLVLGALGLVALYVWLKVAQAEMCARLMAFRLGAEPERFTWRRALALARAQAAPHAWGPAALLIATGLVVPLGRVWMYFQNVTVLGATEKNTARAEDDAWALAKLWPRQSHVGLLVLALLSLAVLLNVAAAIYFLPDLVRALFGVENFMTLSGWSMLNTTFFMCACALTWFVMEPVAKAFCVLRVFHGRSLRTGADMLVEMRGLQARRGTPRRGATVALLMLVAGLFVLTNQPASAAESSAGKSADSAPATVQPTDLNKSIDEVLERRDFKWQLQPEKKDAPKNEGAIMRFFNAIGRFIRSGIESIGDFVDWLDRVFSGRERSSTSHGGAGGAGLAKILLYGTIILVIGLIAWVGYAVWRGWRKDPTMTAKPEAGQEAAPDLRDENVQAAQLPSDGWLQLAREQAALGEWRLALRALYLSHLARLGAQGLLTLRRHKTNLDYERELRRRALRHPAVADRFVVRRREFESTWYGREQAGEQQVRAWFAEAEKETEALP